MRGGEWDEDRQASRLQGPMDSAEGLGCEYGGGVKSIPGLEKAFAEARREQNTGRRVLQKKV